jgi:hypothetical protein
MRLIFLPIVACATIAATPEAPRQADTHVATDEIPAAYLPCRGTVPVFNPEACERTVDPIQPADCGDRIQQVRDASGQPKLDREPAKPDEPLLIAAVDHRIDGCPVMVMRNDVSDVRPLPAPSETVGVIPAH